MTPYDYQISAFRSAVQSSRKIFLSATSCHPAGTKVIMFDGTTKNVENLVVGDILMGPDGTPRNVKETHSGNDKIYKISPKRGNNFYINENHILSLVCTNIRKDNKLNGSIVNISLKDYLLRNKTFKHRHKLYYSTNEITFSKNIKDLPLDPYFVGLLLGDGSLSHNSIGITTMDSEIVEEIYSQAKKHNIEIRISKNKNIENKASSYFFTLGRSRCTYEVIDPNGNKYTVTNLTKFCKDNYLCHSMLITKNKYKGWTCKKLFEKTNNIKNLVRKIGILDKKSEDKFVPDDYKFTSIENRKQILAGLLDTDGHLNLTGTYFEFTSKSERLRNDVSFISRSLGLVVSEKIKFNKKYKRNYYECTIFGNISKIPTKILRKKQFNSTKRLMERTGFDISFDRIDNYYGFTLDGDHLYLLDNFLVTHNSGKSLIQYLISRYYLSQNKKILIIVPRDQLVEQMEKDFQSYSKDEKFSKNNIQKISMDYTKVLSKNIVISTWQSIYKLPHKFFSYFDVVLYDECHLCEASTSQGIMKKCIDIKYKFAFSGTLKEAKTHELVLIGLFGPIKVVATSKELMDDDTIAKLKINCILLNYPEDIKKKVIKLNYKEELDYIISNEQRNTFVKNLALSLKHNTLILFERIDKHGLILYEDIKKQAKDKKVLLIHGKIKVEYREKIREYMEKHDNCILLASLRMFFYRGKY